MNVALAIRQRLNQLRLEQRGLAIAAQVTESYISQLLTGKKVPPAPDRTDIYHKMGEALTPLYYFRDLQNLRDPLHFRT